MLSTDEIELLQLGTEDYYGLFTVDWSFRGRDQTSSATATKQRAQEAIKTLLAQGFVALYYRSAWIGGTETLIPLDQIETVLSNAASWGAPSTDDVGYVCYTTTGKGVNALAEVAVKNTAQNRSTGKIR